MTEKEYFEPQKMLISLNINDQEYDLAVQNHDTLLEVLRYNTHLTGTKQGCDKGDCGACTVLVDGQPTLSCLSLAAVNEGKQIQTIEGLASEMALDPVQEAFDCCGALQCGFCQPGMMLSAKALLNTNPKPSLHEIKQALSGNLCRCTGYTKILESVLLAATQMDVNDDRSLEEVVTELRLKGAAHAQ